MRPILISVMLMTMLTTTLVMMMMNVEYQVKERYCLYHDCTFLSSNFVARQVWISFWGEISSQVLLES